MAQALVIGSAGQLGIELVLALQAKLGTNEVHVSDIRVPENENVLQSRFFHLDATDESSVFKLLEEGNYDEVYHLAAMLSATGEKRPLSAWELNMQSLLNVLEAAKEGYVKRVFWPSSIAVFGPKTPRKNVAQDAVLDPTTVYGVSKLAGEYWCRYYHDKYGVDVRSIRYPGLIGHRSLPGGGTTDYAVDIYHAAVKNEVFHCFLEAGTTLPMMYMDDAVRGTLELMAAPKSAIRVRTSYNLAAMSFTPEAVAESIRAVVPNFQIEYAPDHRQAIASSWPESINDQQARDDWGWNPEIGLTELTQIMLDGISAKAHEVTG